MELITTFTSFFGMQPEPDPADDMFLVYSVAGNGIVFKVAVSEEESLVSLEIRNQDSENPVFSTLQREVVEAVIKKWPGREDCLWFRSATNAVFIHKSPPSVHLK